MGRHSRKDPAPARPRPEAGPPQPGPGASAPYGGELYEPGPQAPGPYEPPSYRPEPYQSGPYEPQLQAGQPYPHQSFRPEPQGPRPEAQPPRLGAYEPERQGSRPYRPEAFRPEPYVPAPGPYEAAPGPRAGTAEPTVSHRGHVPPARPGPRGARPGGHPEQREPGGAWGAGPAPAPGAVYGDWRGVPRTVLHTPPSVRDTDTPAAGFPRVTPVAAPPEPDALTSTGSHRRVPGPRRPGEPAEAEKPPNGRGTRIRTYTGMAAAAVTTVLAVVVAGQVATENDSTAGSARASGDDGADRALSGQSAASRSDGRPTPASPPAQAAPQPTYEEQMARQLPIDAKLAGPGLFDTVPGVAKAPGKGKVWHYRVDVEQGLGLDPQLFAEAVQRTLNDPRSWSHDGAMTFERVPGGEADFVVTLASPGTTGTWCAKSGLDTTVDNVSCDSAATERVMINAFRWAQGSPTYGADQMLAYRQMLINHEVGHRLGHGHVSCQTPGALAPIMQQQTKSLDIDNIHCRPNPWVFPGS
ncbi:DUF3152 domain-containing protein [Streptomyces sp. NPDC059564]|uniref:DUF3152 domain-containing protein n=1 Tax=Streptomyces sp. NPDC059564 TaxID=3346865 RepID=UPI0036B16601